MRINREGYPTICCVALPLIVILIALTLCTLHFGWSWWVTGIVDAGLAYLIFTIFWFFRDPKRPHLQEEGALFSPADGEVVVIEEVEEKEYFGDKRIQISVFMSVTNVHINWFPIGGRIAYSKYHPGAFRVAWHPKSSEENERMSVAIEGSRGAILYRQIAGFVARRIVSYVKVGESVHQNDKCGFIKFGSRIDILLPENAELLVEIGDRVVGTLTPIARIGDFGVEDADNTADE